jgi:uncharacterized protein YecT (DUF1311 family)
MTRMTFAIWIALGLIGTVTACASEPQKATTVQASGTEEGKAQAATSASTVENCGDLAQRPMNECFAREAKQDQQLLEELLKELNGRLGGSEKERLAEAQSLWSRYMDAHCRWRASFFEGGSVQPTMHSTCISSLTWNRIEELKLVLCEGAGMTGPCEASKRYDRPSQASR